MKNGISNVFFRKSPLKMMRAIEKNGGRGYVSGIAKKTGCTYSYTSKVIMMFEECGLLKSKKEGRRRNIELTPNGGVVAENIKKICEIMGEYDE